MPVISTLGAMTSRGLGEFAIQSPTAAYVEDYFSTNLYTGTGAAQTIGPLTNGFTQTTAWSSWTLKRTGGNDSRAYDVVTDSSNNFYVVGSGSSYPGNAILLAKYNSSGVLQWQRSLQQNDSRGISIDVGSSGNVYVMGRANDGTIDYCAIAKYNSSGSLQWQRKLTETAYGTDFGQIKSDSSGNVYVATRIGSGYGIVAKYNSSGTLQWQKKIDASMGASAFGVAVDSSGNVFVSGQLGAGTAFLMKMDSSGSSVWQKEFNSNYGSNGAAFYRLAIDSSGNLYTTGTEYGGISIVKFDSSGNITWNRKLDGDGGYSVNVDSSGNVAVTGYAASPTYIVAALYNSSGVLQWQRKLTVVSTQASNGRGVAFDGLGNVYFASLAQDASNVYFSVVKLKTSGSTVAGSAFLTMSNGTLTDSSGTLNPKSVSYTFSSGTATDASWTGTDAIYDGISTQYDQAAVNANGGMVWIKGRSGATDHALYDTTRGATFDLASNLTSAQTTQTQGVTAFGASTFDIGTLAKLNTSSATYVAWAFSKRSKFFTIVTYTGNGATTQTISHDLGSVPGMIIAKGTSAATDWPVYHRGVNGGVNPEQYYLRLNATSAQSNAVSNWGNTAPTATQFTVGSNNNVNGYTYVAYLFAHNAGGFGADGSQNVISCGSYTGTGTTGNIVNLGYEPQFLLIKKTDSATVNGDWNVFDNMRGLGSSSVSPPQLVANDFSSENGLYGSVPWVAITSTGFNPDPNGSGYGETNLSGSNYIYMAIRRGPMRTPTSGTSVFAVNTGTSGSNAILTNNINADFISSGNRTGGYYWAFGTNKLSGKTETGVSNNQEWRTGGSYISEWGNSSVKFGTSGDMNGSGRSQVWYSITRAPSFMDIVCYTGTYPTAKTVTHNLGVAPELMIVKRRDTNSVWTVYSLAWLNQLGVKNRYGILNTTDNFYTTDPDVWNNQLATATSFQVNNSATNASGAPLIAFLFASCPGVSSVGIYTGTGSTQTISCGFSGGARFVLIKRADGTSDWWVWDTSRGMVSGTDPRIAFNLSTGETNANWVYTTTGGFQIVTSDSAVNGNGASYIYLAIA